MFPVLHSLLLTAALIHPLPGQETPRDDSPFPPSTALAEGLSPDSLTGLSDLVQGLVDDGEIVGAELLVIKNGRSVLHQGYGWRDQEEKIPMEPGGVFCVRSMTKPLAGTAMLMLIEEKKIGLSDRVSEYLPSFEAQSTREITVEQLLTHTSGLPMSLLLNKELNDLDGIGAVADLGAGYELLFEPGTDLHYSDQGTDTITALIEVVSGMSPEEFVRSRILVPLGMQDSACVLPEDHPLRERGVTKYLGNPGAWNPYWTPKDAPLFPFFLGSQALYSTLEDYARFMDMWLKRGRGGEAKLLRLRSVRKALTPSEYPLGSSTALPGLEARYGYLMQLWVRPGQEDEDGKRAKDEVVAFGHSGSDGTHAWVFPEQKAMVLYFTQSRFTSSGLHVEEALGDLLLGVPFDANQLAPPLDEYLGYYRDAENDVYRAIIRDGDDLAMEVLGRAIVPLTYIGEDRWKLRPDPSKVIAFERSEAGAVVGYSVGDHREFRFEPSADLPSPKELNDLVSQAHRLDLLESVGPMRIRSQLDIDAVDIHGEMVSLLAWPGRMRLDTHAGDNFEQVSIDGDRIQVASSEKEVSLVEGERAEAILLDTPFARYGDWSHLSKTITVIQRVEEGDNVGLIVRLGDTSGPATTLIIDGENGHVVRQLGMVHVDVRGRVGQRAKFGEFREVSGILLAHRTETQLAIPMLGTIVTTIQEVEVGVELAEDAFELKE